MGSSQMGSSQMLQQAIDDWRNGEQCAPHKPLLLLYVLAGYRQGHGRLFNYASEDRDNLHSLLERFGPQRAQYRPDMPFWRLQGTVSGNCKTRSAVPHLAAVDDLPQVSWLSITLLAALISNITTN